MVQILTETDVGPTSLYSLEPPPLTTLLDQSRDPVLNFSNRFNLEQEDSIQTRSLCDRSGQHGDRQRALRIMTLPNKLDAQSNPIRCLSEMDSESGSTAGTCGSTGHGDGGPLIVTILSICWVVVGVSLESDPSQAWIRHP